MWSSKHLRRRRVLRKRASIGMIEPLRRPATRGSSPGQAVVEAALSMTFLIVLFGLVVSVGEFIGYDIGLSNAGAAAATAAFEQADLGTSGNPTQGAVAAVNQEQGSTSWTACGTTITAPCVSVTSTSQNTGGSTTVTVEQVTLHGTYTPVFSLLGITIPVTIQTAAST